MAERRRGRGRGRKPGLAADLALNEVVATNEEDDEEWNKVVEKKQVAYNPDKVRSKQVEIAKVRVMDNEEELETGWLPATSSKLRRWVGEQTSQT